MSLSAKHRLVLLIFVIFTVWLSFYILQPPSPLPATSPATEFSAERAFTHIQQIAQRPHPLGTAANDSVRAYIINELKQLGLSPEVQEGIGVSEHSFAGYAQNVVAKIPGQNPSHALLLMAHYDSTPVTPGAADDGSGTAAILETARAILAQKQPLKNDVWLLFTDGEERGLLGAELFADTFPELDTIDLVLNVEARGSSGPSMMFETSSPNNTLITHFAEASSYPVANSLMYTVYKLLPNDTDMSVTKEAGLPGLNFAFTEDFLNYHTMLDTPENLSRASLQHHGANLIDNVRYFGNRSLNLDSSSEYVYFNNATGGLIYYPSSWSLPLAVVTTLLFLAYLIFLFRTRQLSSGKYVISMLLFLGITVLAGLVTFFGWKLLKIIHPEYNSFLYGETYWHSWYFWGFTLLITGFFASIYSWIQNKLSAQQLMSGGFTFWILLSLVSSWYLPTASYLFTWPVLMALVGWIILGERITEYSWRTTGFLAVSYFGALFMVSPYIKLVHIMMTTDMLAVSMILLVAVLALAWPLIWQLIHPQKKAINTLLLLGGLLCFVGATMVSDFDDIHKKHSSINFVQNLDSGKAYWVSRDDTTDTWTQQFLGTNYNTGILPDNPIPRSGEVLYNPADTIHIPTPAVTVLADSSSDSLRYVKLQLDSHRGNSMFAKWKRNASITTIAIHGKTVYSVSKQPKRNNFYYFQNLQEPVKLNVQYQNTTAAPSLNLSILDSGLPTEQILGYRPRPKHTMPAPYSLFKSDATVWQVTIDLQRILSSQ